MSNPADTSKPRISLHRETVKRLRVTTSVRTGGCYSASVAGGGTTTATGTVRGCGGSGNGVTEPPTASACC
jgi:hypothetical protein